MTADQISTFLHKFERCSVLVVGDVMLDEYLWGHIQRISPEAPVPILNLVSKEHTLGGAGNVVKNLRSLGAQVLVLSVVGTDVTGNHILEELDKLAVDCTGIIREADRKSTRKSRIMSAEHGQQVFRFDQESTHLIESDTQEALLSLLRVKIESVQAVLCSDYLKGVLTPKVLKTAFAIAGQHRLPVVVCPKDSNPSKYQGASVLIPNVGELQQLSETRVDGTGSLNQAALCVLQRLKAQSLLVTRGREGMSLFESAWSSVHRIDIPTVARSVYDVTGAGDTVASVFTLAIAAGANHEIAARLANLAAGIVVEKLGTACVTPAELVERVGEQTTVKPPLAYNRQS